ncbi:hypothetical protein D922_01866 [Enterococcus faecalis 06-MB-DW-09]|nr:hypothetical protein D931_01467 [Enterococcus faecium 13.SD.W.09]EPH93325.1 hypothetical protein D922_01866 [Enterococcus faecalis 06-MB-DW-09]
MTGVFYCKEKNFVIGFYRGLSPRFFLENEKIRRECYYEC